MANERTERIRELDDRLTPDDTRPMTVEEKLKRSRGSGGTKSETSPPPEDDTVPGEGRR